MKKTFLFFAAFLLFGLVSLKAQSTLYLATDVCFSKLDSTGVWGDWGEWIEDDSEITIDFDNDEIVFYDSFWDLEIYYTISDYTEETADEDGDLITEFHCFDEEFSKVRVKLLKRISEEDQRTEIYFYYESSAEAYIVIGE